MWGILSHEDNWAGPERKWPGSVMGCLRERKRKPTLEIRELLRLNKAHCIQAIVIDELSKKSYLQHLQPCDGTGSNSSHQFGCDRPWLHFCSYQSSCRICPLKNKTNCSLCFMSNFQLKISKHKPNSHIFLQRVIAYIVLFKLWFFFNDCYPLENRACEMDHPWKLFIEKDKVHRDFLWKT